MHCHRQHEALFALHQRALLALRMDEARDTLSRYGDELLRHMALEETLVLPLYQTRGGERPGGDVSIFEFEHAKLRRWLSEIQAQLASTADLPAEALPDAVIALLDRECGYKNLMAHHDKREATMLYPRLDELTSDEERSALVPRLLSG